MQNLKSIRMQIENMPTLLLVGLVFSLYSCDSKQCRETVAIDAPLNLEITRLEKIMDTLETQEDIAHFMEDYPDFHTSYLKSEEMPKKYVAANIHKLVQDPMFDTLNQAVLRRYEDISFLENQLGEAFARLKKFYPDFEPPKIYTATTGFGTDIFYEDHVLIISLDYFLEDTKYRPSAYLPNYILRRRTKRHLVPSILLLMSKDYNQVDLADNTMLNEMVKWGKTHYFVSKLLPCTHDSLIIGYTSEEFDGIEYNQKKVWEYYIENELFYETNSFKIQKFVQERPFTQEIDLKCPGRTGQWLGWKFVKNYARKEEKNLPEIMATRDARLIFEKSKFKPKTFDQE